MKMKSIIQSGLLLLGVSTMAAEAVEFGTFSVSLGVKNMAASKDFYEKLGFSRVVGEPDKGWLIRVMPLSDSSLSSRLALEF